MAGRDQLKQFWQKLNEIKVEDIIPYLKQNKKVSLLLGLAVIVVVGLFFLIRLNQQVFSTAEQQTDPGPKANTPAATVMLPEPKRTIDDRPAIKDPFSGTMTLKGVITGGGGSNLAIIEIGNISYVAAQGDELAGGLVVEEVKGDLVILKSAQDKVLLQLNGRMKQEKIKTEAAPKPAADSTKQSDQAKEVEKQ